MFLHRACACYRSNYELSIWNHLETLLMQAPGTEGRTASQQRAALMRESSSQVELSVLLLC